MIYYQSVETSSDLIDNKNPKIEKSPLVRNVSVQGLTTWAFLNEYRIDHCILE